MSKISFAASKEDHELIEKIVERAVGMWREADHDLDIMTAMMDITACHANGCPLKLQELYNAKGTDFAHDVGGIMRHINRQTGQLGDCFLPRYADLSKETKQ